MSDFELPATTVTASRHTTGDALQYLRKASLLVGADSGDALDLSELRFTFNITRGDSQTPNSARITIYNMAPQTAVRAQEEFKRVVVQAGYAGNFGIIFDGTIKQTRLGRSNQTDTCLHITAADGDSAYNFAVVAMTLASGSTPTDHVNACANAMTVYGVAKGYCAGLDGNPLPRGKVMFGMARDFMRQAARGTQTTWSIQDGKIVTIPESGYMPDEIPVINFESGLVGMPMQTQHGIEFRVLLNPSIKIGTLVRLDNRSIQRYEQGTNVMGQGQTYRSSLENKLQADGLYYVMWANHQGDTRGNDWYTDVVCLAADVTVLPDQAVGKLKPVDGSALASLNELNAEIARDSP